MILNRRGLLGGAAALLAAPAIVRADSLMKLSCWREPLAAAAIEGVVLLQTALTSYGLCWPVAHGTIRDSQHGCLESLEVPPIWSPRGTVPVQVTLLRGSDGRLRVEGAPAVLRFHGGAFVAS